MYSAFDVIDVVVLFGLFLPYPPPPRPLTEDVVGVGAEEHNGVRAKWDAEGPLRRPQTYPPATATFAETSTSLYCFLQLHGGGAGPPGSGHAEGRLADGAGAPLLAPAVCFDRKDYDFPSQ